MRKNKTMRAATLLLALVLITSCFVGSTFAKYVTSGNGSDSARVAKWGVSVTGTSDSAFAKFYKDTKLTANDATCTVASDVNVVAPGTNGTFAAYAVTGTPEVDVDLTYSATVTFSGDWEGANGNYYCPIVVKVNGTAVTAGSDAATYAQNIKNAIEAVDDTITYEAGTDLSAVNDDIAITWEWAIGDASADDTRLGDIAAGIVTGKTAPQISIETTATITQID